MSGVGAYPYGGLGYAGLGYGAGYAGAYPYGAYGAGYAGAYGAYGAYGAGGLYASGLGVGGLPTQFTQSVTANSAYRNYVLRRS